jgi:hypothetical protein
VTENVVVVFVLLCFADSIAVLLVLLLLLLMVRRFDQIDQLVVIELDLIELDLIEVYFFLASILLFTTPPTYTIILKKNTPFQQ